MKIMRWLGIAIGAGFFLLGATAIALYAYFDGEKIKAEITRQVMTKTQRELVITAPVKLSFWPNVGIVLGKTSLSEPNSKSTFLTVDSARVSVAVMPLFAGQARVNGIAADGLRVTLVKRKDGTMNTADLSQLSGKNKDEDKDENVGAGKTALSQLDIADIALTNAHVVWQDEQAGSQTTLARLNITTGQVLAESQQQTIVVEDVVLKNVDFVHKNNVTRSALGFEGLAFSADEVNANGQLKTVLAKALTLSTRQFIQRDDITGNMTRAQGVSLTSDQMTVDVLQGTVQVNALMLKNKQLTQQDGKTGVTTRLDDVDFSAAHLAAHQPKQTLAIDKFAFIAKGQRGSNAFAIDLTAPKLNITPDKVTGQTIQLAVQWAGSGRQTRAKIKLEGVEGTLSQARIARMALDAESKSGPAILSVNLTTSVSANLAEQVFSLPNVVGSLVMSSPAMPMKKVNLPLNGRAQIDLKKQHGNLILATQFDESKIFVDAQANKFSPLDLRFGFKADRLNMDKYFPPKPPAAVADEGNSVAEKSAPLNFSAIRGLNMQGTIQIGALQIQNLKFAQFNANLNVANNRLLISPLRANLYGGSMNGSLTVDAQDNRVVIKQSLLGVRVHPLLMDLANKDILEGTGTVSLDVAGRGASVDALKKSLTGSASIALRDGAIKGINLAQKLRDLKNKLALNKATATDNTQASRKEEKTDFSEMTASFQLNKGVAHNNDLFAKSPFLRLTGEGDVDIGLGQINYLAKARVVNTSSGQDGKNADQVAGVTVPVRITGPLDKITWKIEFAKAIGDLIKEKTEARVDAKKQEIKQKIDEKKDALKQKATDQLKDKLKGLFGQ